MKIDRVGARHFCLGAFGVCGIATTFSYFEMIGKILNLASNAWNTSAIDFKHGFCDVYPDNPIEDLAEFRDRVRNGMFHLGYTKTNLLIDNDPSQWPDDFMVTTESDGRYYRVNPHGMTRTIVAHFATLMTRLRDPENIQLQAKFAEFYLTYHQGSK